MHGIGKSRAEQRAGTVERDVPIRAARTLTFSSDFNGGPIFLCYGVC